MGNIIGFRLRKGHDDDIIHALANNDDDADLSDLAREGLRKVLGLTGSRKVVYSVIPIKSKPALFNPKRGGEHV